MGLVPDGCAGELPFSIACFSHIPWQSADHPRLREILTRLAGWGVSVYYIECTTMNAGGGTSDEPEGIVRLRVHYNYDNPRWSGMQKWLCAQKIAWFFRRHGVRRPVMWFTHPSLFPLGYSHEDSGIIYDVVEMWPAAALKDSDLYFDELMMLAEADVAFAGGEGVFEHLRGMVSVLMSDLNASGGGRSRAASEGPTRLVTMPAPGGGADWDDLAREFMGHLEQLTAVQSGCGSR